MRNKANVLPLLGVALAVGLLLPEHAHAAGAGGSLPWEGPIQTLTNSIKGPVAYGISLVAIVASGIALVFGAEISDFVRKMLMLTLVISIIVFATNFLSTMFGASGAGVF